MLPSLLTRDIQQGLQQFPVTGFEPSDNFLHGLMGRFVKDHYRMLDYLLLRRLRARLKTPPDHLICTGTSATLGSSSDTSALRDYERQIFGSPFTRISAG